MTEDKNMIKIQALEAMQKILFDRADMLHKACFSEEAMNIYNQCYGVRFDQLNTARTKVLTKSTHICEVIGILSDEILKLCKE